MGRMGRNGRRARRSLYGFAPLTHRLRLAALAVPIMVLSQVAIFPAGQVGAVDNTGQFEMDGNIVQDAAVAPPYDWASLFDSSGNKITPKPATLLDSVFVKDAATPDNTYFTSDKDTYPIGTGGTEWGCSPQATPTPKDDIQNTYAAVFKIPGTAPENAGHTVVYLGVERLSNNGDSFAGFWLFKDPSVGCSGTNNFSGTHTNGDILILTNFTNGGGTANVTVFEWEGGPTGGPVAVSLGSNSGGVCGTSSGTGGDSVCAISNTATITSPWAPTSHDANTFTEAALDLTSLFGGSASGPCFSNFQAETRSSQEITATLKDFAGGLLNTCTKPPVTTLASGHGSSQFPGSAQHDTATVTGTPAPTGTATFFLCSPTQTTSAGCPSGAGTQVGSAVKLTTGTGSSTAQSTPDVTGITAPNDLALGTYCWGAQYTPDTASQDLYLASYGTDNTNECFTVAKASPTITTQASPTTGTAGVAITPVKDTATFHNTNSSGYPTGSVTFTLYSNNTCTAAVAGVSGTGTISTTAGVSTASYSTNWTPTTTGTYYWIASYAGDSNNNGFTTTCGDSNEQIGVVKASPTITTQTSPTTGTAGVAITPVKDTATLSSTGAAAPTGSVSFTLYSNNTCTAAVAGVSGSGTISTTGGVSTASYSTNWTPTTAGTYYWIASYAGDANNNGFTTTCGDDNEQITIAKASPTITTQTSPTTGTAGVAITPVKDTATFSSTGAAAPTGSVSFTLYSNNTCTAAVTGVSGSGTISTTAGVSTASYSTNWTPPASGTYYWLASYAGDANNSGFTTTCGDANEQITIGKASPTITTQASPTTGTAGVPITPVKDTATFHSTTAAGPTGSVSFALYSDNTCLTPVTGVSGSGTISTTGGVSTASYSTNWTPTATGTYYWIASYAGDSNNNGFTTTCGDSNEQITVGKASPTITTQASPTSGTAGVAITPVKDTATFSTTGAAAPTGSVTFTLYSEDTCTTPVAGVSGSGTISTTGGVSTASYSTNWTPTATGTYYWIASYAGDANNNPFTTTCGDSNEQIGIGKASPTITTQASPTTGTSGVALTSVGDTATFRNTTTVAPTGSVTFTLYSEDTCTTAVAGVSGSGTISTTSGVSTASYSTTWTPPAAGTYYWIASYAGDANNNGFTTGCGDDNEQITIAKASPTITTQASPTTGTRGVAITPLKDTATFHNTTTVAPTGSVTFALYSDNTCTTPVAGVSGSGAISTTGGVSTASYSTTWTPAAAGTYYWIASYAGDANNNGFTTTCGDSNEEILVLAPSLGITKTADATPVSEGTSIGFTVTVTNAGPGIASNVTVNDPLPPGTGVVWSIDSQAATACSITGSAPTQILVCSIGDMAAAATYTVHIISPTGTGSAGTYPNVGTVSAGNAPSMTANATIVVTAPSGVLAISTPSTGWGSWPWAAIPLVASGFILLLGAIRGRRRRMTDA
jgi:Domain of unknown function DUF11